MLLPRRAGSRMERMEVCRTAQAGSGAKKMQRTGRRQWQCDSRVLAFVCSRCVLDGLFVLFVCQFPLMSCTSVCLCVCLFVDNNVCLFD